MTETIENSKGRFTVTIENSKGWFTVKWRIVNCGNYKSFLFSEINVFCGTVVLNYEKNTPK